MSMKTFEAQVRLQSHIAIIDLKGEINTLAEEALQSAYSEAEEYGTGAILLNFAAVDYVNSTGIALIVGLLARARKAQRQLLACGLSEHYVEIFRITRLADFLQVFPDEASALASEETSA
jgi:anti-sigma B factor antagonist